MDRLGRRSGIVPHTTQKGAEQLCSLWTMSSCLRTQNILILLQDIEKGLRYPFDDKSRIILYKSLAPITFIHLSF
ncbi:unnamed protein product, partial [Brenthis ino]